MSSQQLVIPILGSAVCHMSISHYIFLHDECAAFKQCIVFVLQNSFSMAHLIDLQQLDTLHQHL